MALWAALAWLSVLADNEGMSVGDVVKQHWKEYGRDLYCGHDYGEVASEGAQAMMAHLGSLIGSGLARSRPRIGVVLFVRGPS